jgi:CubicO group peptidase (beta-lactamase class C family)
MTNAFAHDARSMARLLAVASCSAAFAACTHVADSPDLTARVDAVMGPLVAAHEFSGAVVLTRRGEVVYQRGFGMANHGASLPFTPDTASDGGSLAKTFTAAGVWWLADEGKVVLDAPVAGYVPGFPHARTTVRQLLAHSNGLTADYESFDPHFAPDEPRTTEAMLALISRQAQPPGFPPGTRFEYSSLGYDVAALVIERASGQTYEAFLKDRFFARLGMRSSFVRPARLADWPGARTLGYRWRGGTWQPFDVFDMEAFRGGSNLYFSANDLSQWARANATGTALPAAALAAGQRRARIDGRPTSITELSWYCDDAGSRCYYTGDLNAFFSLVFWDRERDETVVYVSNSSLPPWRQASLGRDLVDALAGSPMRAGNAGSFERFNEQTRSAVAGAYAARGIGAIVITAGTGPSGLRLRIDDGLEYDVFQVSADVFYCPAVDLWLGFKGGPQPTTLHLRSIFVDAIANRAT